MNILLYALLGLLLSVAGVSILTQPAYFVAILLVVAGIDLSKTR